MITKTIILVQLVITFPLFSQNEIAKDIELYRTTITKNHKNPFKHLSKSRFDIQIDSLVSKIPILTRPQATVELLKINAQISDEHTMVLPSTNFKLPVKFKIFDDGVLIVSADSTHQKLLLHKIIAINNNPIIKVLDSLKTLVKLDNPSFTLFLQEYYLNNTLILNGLGILNNYDEVNLSLVSPDNKEMKRVLNLIKEESDVVFKNADTTLLANSKTDNYWYDFNKDKNILYFNYQRCAESQDKPFSDFNSNLFKIVERQKPSKLILDLRFNSGGNSSVLKPFIESIQESYLNSNNRFYILIGKKVMSSSLMNAVELKRKTNATFVGQSTGGNINHFGEIRYVLLTHLNSRITYSTKYWENWKDHNGALHPDILTPSLVLDYVNGIDRAMKTIYEIRD